MKRHQKLTIYLGGHGIGSVIAFLLGWLIFGLLGAIIVTIIALVLLGYIGFSLGKRR